MQVSPNKYMHGISLGETDISPRISKNHCIQWVLLNCCHWLYHTNVLEVRKIPSHFNFPKLNFRDITALEIRKHLFSQN